MQFTHMPMSRVEITHRWKDCQTKGETEAVIGPIYVICFHRCTTFERVLILDRLLNFGFEFPKINICLLPASWTLLNSSAFWSSPENRNRILHGMVAFQINNIKHFFRMQFVPFSFAEVVTLMPCNLIASYLASFSLYFIKIIHVID